jgi:hypothetical protein
MNPFPENIADAIWLLSFAIALLFAVAITSREKPKRRPPWG